jgi:hypothetical protein
MSDLTLPLIGLTTLVGYFFSQDGRNPRRVERVREGIETFDRPNGRTIYSSDVVKESNDEILNRSLQNYKDSENPSETGFIPPLFNTYSVVGNDSALSPALIPDISGLTSDQLGKLNDVNRLKNVVSTTKEPELDTRPMFKPLGNFVGQEITEENVGTDLGLPYKRTEINLLTGKPFEQAHNNMVPFFGSNVKQNVETFSNESLLDSRTGNTSTFKHKKETGSFQDKRSENIYGNPVFSTQVDIDRYIPSLYRQNERPVEQELVSAPIAGTIDNNIRPVFKDVNELRPGNRPKETYKGRVLSGKMGENRGNMGEFAKNRPDTFFENEHRFRGPGEFIGPKVREDYSQNMKSSARQSYNIEYYGAVHNSSHLDSKQRLSNVDNSQEFVAYFQDPRRNNFENDYLRNVEGTIVKSQSGHDYGRSALRVPESERATTGDKTHLMNANVSSMGIKIRSRDDAKTTLKQTTMKTDNTGNLASSFNFGANMPYHTGLSNVVAKETHKESLVDNKYKGQANQDRGMGYVVNKHEAKITGKQIVTEASKDYITNPGKIVKNQLIRSTFENPEKVRNAIHPEYRGNANYSTESESRVRFDNAVIRDDKQELLMGERPSGPQNFQTASGKDSFGDIKITENMLLKEQIDSRSKIVNDFKHIPSKDQLGIQVKVRLDDEPVDTVVGDRFEPELLKSQLSKNPFVIDTSKKL